MMTVSSVDNAQAVLEYFNYFHDGFMKRIVVESQDQMDEDRSQTCTGLSDVEIDFAHYNYARGAEPLQPYNQIVRATFRNVQDVFADFRAGFLGNTIIRLSITLASRRRWATAAPEECLGLRLARHFYLEEYRRYELRESDVFTFTDATFVELPAS